jgi:hypothetical protein
VLQSLPRNRIKPHHAVDAYFDILKEGGFGMPLQSYIRGTQRYIGAGVA